MTEDDYVTQYVGLARQLAADRASSWPQRERADIESDAYLGLLRAARTYDPDAGMTFIGWARIKIKAEIIAGIRNRHGRADKLDRVKVRRTLGPPKAGWHEVPLITDRTERDFDHPEPDPGPDLLALNEAGFGMVELAASLDRGFTDRNRGVLVELASGYTCAEVGARRGVSEARTSQMRRQIRERARELGVI